MKRRAFALAAVYQEARRFDGCVQAVSTVAAARPADDAVAFRLGGAAYDAAGRVADAERTFGDIPRGAIRSTRTRSTTSATCSPTATPR